MVLLTGWRDFQKFIVKPPLFSQIKSCINCSSNYQMGATGTRLGPQKSLYTESKFYRHEKINYLRNTIITDFLYKLLHFVLPNF